MGRRRLGRQGGDQALREARRDMGRGGEIEGGGADRQAHGEAAIGEASGRAEAQLGRRRRAGPVSGH